MNEIQNQQQADFVNAMNAISTLVDIAKRDPLILVLAGAILLFIGILGVL